MLVDPKLVNTSFTADRDIDEWLRKGETYTFPIKKLAVGVYEIEGFNFNLHIGDLVPESNWRLILPDCKSQYGVADNYQQILAAYPLTIEHPHRHFVLSVTAMRKEDQSPEDGWRWEKWGEYIGTQKPQCEYLFDEPDIQLVYVFHWYELKINEI